MDTEIWVTVHCSLHSGGHSQPGKWRTSHISLPVKLWQEAKWPGPQSNPMHLWAIGKWMPFFPLPPSEDSLSHQSFSAHLHGPKWLFPPALVSYWYWIPGPHFMLKSLLPFKYELAPFSSHEGEYPRISMLLFTVRLLEREKFRFFNETWDLGSGALFS